VGGVLKRVRRTSLGMLDIILGVISINLIVAFLLYEDKIEAWLNPVEQRKE
jgi:hypothetical protein